MTPTELTALGHVPMSPLKALRLRCLDCCCFQQNEVKLCTATRCPSWPFRMGKNPWRQPPSEAQREHARELGRRRYPEVGKPHNGCTNPSESLSPVPQVPGNGLRCASTPAL